MSNSYFQFKQFVVRHDRCAMKVGTDGVLLGAWAPVRPACRVLDVGTGSGLVALQLAQRAPQADILAVEVDAEAAVQAAENVAASPWPSRIRVVCADFTTFASDSQFDLIVSNPPYFTEALQCPDSQRRLARHTVGLDYMTIFARSSALLAEGGTVCIIFPAEAEGRVLESAACSGLYPYRRLSVFTKPGKPLRRLLLVFSKALRPCLQERLCIHQTDGSYSDEYRALTEAFYLNF